MVDRYPARVLGPLASYVAGFRAELVVLGYTPRVAQDSAYVLAHLSRWLESEGIAAAELTSQQVVRFAGARREGGYRRWVTVRSLRRQLGYLRETGVIPQEEHREIGCPVERALQACRLCLHRERWLAERTARQRADVARRFLRAQVKEGELRLDRLGPAAVIGFIVDESRRYATASMKVTTTVRSLLRYLFVTGVIDRDLAEAVPSVASWRMSGLPAGADTGTVTLLLASCDQATGVGCRDFAVLMLMARLGLRAHEVAALCLDDVDWRAGELVIHGKGGRVDRLPLPADAGAALAGYLRQSRRPSVRREVFLRSCGPGAPMSRQSAVMVTRCASRRAGIPPIGAHQLRHRAASRVLAQGGSLAGVAQLLRHHGGETAAIYAKADRAALLIVTHNIEEAVILAERIFVLGANSGRIRAEIQCAFPRPATGTARASRHWSTRFTGS